VAKVLPVTHTRPTGTYAEVLQQAPLRTCWPDTCANKLPTPLGKKKKKKKDLSVTMADDKGTLCDLDPKNIIDMTDGDVPDVKHQAFGEYQCDRTTQNNFVLSPKPVHVAIKQ
jgi:hypothetical protein